MRRRDYIKTSLLREEVGPLPRFLQEQRLTPLPSHLTRKAVSSTTNSSSPAGTCKARVLPTPRKSFTRFLIVLRFNWRYPRTIPRFHPREQPRPPSCR
jgi:hypothetical protein